jgi:hypothetical protein
MLEKSSGLKLSGGPIVPGAVRAMLAASLLGSLSLGGMAVADAIYTVELGAGGSDNLTRVPLQPVSEGVATAGLEVSWTEVRQRIDGNLLMNLDYRKYLDNTYDDRVLGTADGRLVFGLVPERFTWLLQDSFGQAQADPFAVATPDTQENLNYATTGPDLTFRFGSVSAVRLYGRYSVTEYERSLLDSDRTSAGAAIGRPFSDGRELMLNAVREQVSFDDAVQAGYERDNLYLSYRRDAGRTDASIEAGYSWLDRDVGVKSSGALLRVSVMRNLSASMTLDFSFGTELTDSSSSLRQLAGGAGSIGPGAVTASSDPFTTRFANLGWDLRRNRTGIGFGASWNDDSYESQASLDRVRWVYDAHLDRQLSRTLTASLVTSWTKDDYLTAGAEATEWMTAGSFAWAFGRHFGLQLRVERFDRDTSNQLGEYQENRGFLTLFYRSGPDRR